MTKVGHLPNKPCLIRNFRGAAVIVPLQFVPVHQTAFGQVARKAS